MTNDYILKIIDSAAKIIAKVFLNKEQKEIQNINIEAMNEKDILPILLKRLTLEGKYNKAENILFEEMRKNPCEDIVNIGVEFYNGLLLKSDEELIKQNFSRKEIYQGLDDLKRLKIENQ
jgi:hypothetical protein